jgi:RNA polymerase sigma-70 factor (ECF subfamily)
MRIRRRDVSGSELNDLALRAQKGDREAFDQLVRHTYADTYSLAYRLTGNESDARDVAQDVYLRAFRSIKTFRGDAQITTWLYRVTANCSSTFIQRRTRRSTTSLDADEFLSNSAAVVDDAPDNNPEIAAAAAIDRQSVEALVACLPPRLRAVVVLRDAYDMPHDVIARELGITETAAKVRLHRARKMLKSWLEESGNELLAGRVVQTGDHYGKAASDR